MRIRRTLPRWPVLLLLGALALQARLIPAADVTADIRAVDSEARMKKDIFFLASDECEGRGPTTKGINIAADYIAAEFKKAGLKPGTPDGSYFQPFTIPGAIQDAPATLAFKGPNDQTLDLKEGNQFYPMALGGAGMVTDAEVVFAGYGTAAGPLKYDDYADLNVEGKVVIVLGDVPRNPNKEKDAPQFPRNAGSLTGKIKRAETAKAAALLFVNDADTVKTGDDLLDFNYTAVGSSSGKIPVFHLKRSALETMLKASGSQDLAVIEETINKQMKPLSLELKGWTANLELKMHRGKLPLKNLVGVLEGNGPLAKETVVVGSHYDHLGYGGAGGSLAGLKKPAIHYEAADDNGSGTTAGSWNWASAASSRHEGTPGPPPGLHVLQRRGARPERLAPLRGQSALSAGGHGVDVQSRHGGPACRQDTSETLLVEGNSTSTKTFDELVEKINKNYDCKLKKADKFLPNSDHYSFYQKKIPVLFFWTGIHADYHRPTDTADKINIAGMRKIVDLSVDVLQQMTTVEKRPDYVAGKSSSGGGGGGNGPRNWASCPTYTRDEGMGACSFPAYRKDTPVFSRRRDSRPTTASWSWPASRSRSSRITWR